MKRKEKKKEITAKEKYYISSQWQLMWRKFKRHRLALFGVIILIIFYTIAAFCEFLSPHDIYKRHSKYIYSPPQRIHFFDEEGNFHLHPFVYGLKVTVDPKTWQRIYIEDKTKKYPIYFFIRSHRYKFWNLFETNIHLFGVKEGQLFLLGTDRFGRDLFSRNLYAFRTSLSIGLLGVGLAFILGSILGGISGYFGGTVDVIIQRIIELLLCVPQIPLWMALTAALPADWSSIKIYFFIVLILSSLGWCRLARVVRGKLLDLKEEDFCVAAKIAGASEMRIIIRHLLPSFFSYLVVSLTLGVPEVILAETALSFLDLGLRPPVVSWGTLLKDAQSIRSVALYPWLLVPGLFVIIAVLAFNFVGDGLRDAADPYK